MTNALRDSVEVNWPLNSVVDTQVKVVLMHKETRYLAAWESISLLNQYGVGVLTQLPKAWLLLS